MPAPVDEQEWRRMGFIASPLVDHLKHAPGSFDEGPAIEPCV
jgi:hypothetical protein